MYALSTPKEKTPTAALRAAKRGPKPSANRPFEPKFTGIKAWGKRNEEPPIQIPVDYTRRHLRCRPHYHFFRMPHEKKQPVARNLATDSICSSDKWAQLPRRGITISGCWMPESFEDRRQSIHALASNSYLVATTLTITSSSCYLLAC